MQNVFDFPLVGRFKLLHVMLVLMTFAFLQSLRALQIIHQSTMHGAIFPAVPGAEVTHLSKRWRAERNMWISGFACAAWIFLSVFYREAAARMALEDKLSDIENSDINLTSVDPSQSREVTSHQRLVSPRVISPSPSPQKEIKKVAINNNGGPTEKQNDEQQKQRSTRNKTRVVAEEPAAAVELVPQLVKKDL